MKIADLTLFAAIAVVSGAMVIRGYPVLQRRNDAALTPAPAYLDGIKYLDNNIQTAVENERLFHAIHQQRKLEWEALHEAIEALMLNGKYKSRTQELERLRETVLRRKEDIDRHLKKMNLLQTNNNNSSGPMAPSTAALANETSIRNGILMGDEESPTTPNAGANKDVETLESSGGRPLLDKEEQEEEEKEDEEPKGVAGIFSNILGSLIGPEGNIDVGTLVGLISTLSVENPDGTYNFDELSNLIGGLLAGAGDEGGGSNVGAFLGGLLGALIKGSAGPKGAKGAGGIVANIFTSILPGLSAPPASNGDGDKPTQKGLDSGGFLAGFLNNLITGSSANSSGSSPGKPSNGGIFSKIKLFIFRTIFSIVTGASAGASAGSSGVHY